MKAELQTFFHSTDPFKILHVICAMEKLLLRTIHEYNNIMPNELQITTFNEVDIIQKRPLPVYISNYKTNMS